MSKTDDLFRCDYRVGGVSCEAETQLGKQRLPAILDPFWLTDPQNSISTHFESAAMIVVSHGEKIHLGKPQNAKWVQRMESW
jgi:hypothetical protein